MDGFCRGCLIKYDEPMELLQYTEKNRRLFVYSTGLQVKRNDSFTFQLCKSCYLNMKVACKFKKLCRTSDKRFKNYLALKDVGEPMDFCTFLKNNDESLTFRLPMISGNSTPANQKYRDDDNESTCTSIRNFMTDILQGEEMPDTEARIIREVIEEEADVLDDSLDSHWLQDDMSIDADFRLDLSFSPFSTPRSVNNDRCFTPKKNTDPKDEEMQFYSTNSEKQNQIVKDFTNAYKDENNVKDDFINAFKEQITKVKDDFTNEFKDPSNVEDDFTNKFKEQTHVKDCFKNAIKDGTNEKDNFTNVFKSQINLEDNLTNVLENQRNVKELCDYDIPSIDQIDGIDKSQSNLDLPILDVTDKSNINIQNFYVAKDIVSIEPSKGINNDSISMDNIDATVLVKDKHCTIDKNLEEALKNGENKEFSLDDLLVSPPVYQATSAASTPTIRNILFGEKLNIVEKSINPKLGQCIDSFDDVQGDIEIFEEFFKNDTKEFDAEDIKNSHIEINTDSKEPISLDNIEIDKLVNKSIKSMDIFNNEMKLINSDLNLSIIENKAVDIDLDISFGEKKITNVDPDVSINETINRELDILLTEKKSIIEDIESIDIDLEIVPSDKDQVSNDDEIKEVPATVKENDIKELNIFSADHSDKFDLENFYCHLCSKKYKGARALCIHFVKIHRIKIIRPIDNSTKHAPGLCSKCGKEFKQLKNYCNHIKNCQKPIEIFKCNQCPVECTSQNKLNRHMNVHKPKSKKEKDTDKVTKKFICPVCGASFNRVSTYELHVKKHTKNYLMSCERCGQGFFRPSDHAAHMRSHKNIRPFSCKFCSLSFTRRDVLARHIRVHTGEKIYDCEDCNKKFRYKYELHRHMDRKSCLSQKIKNHQGNNIDRVEIKTETKEQVTVIYMKGDANSIRNQLPFLETDLSN